MRQLQQALSGSQARNCRARPCGLDPGFLEGWLRPWERETYCQRFVVFRGKLLVTGSYNWTDSAERLNRENAVLLDDAAVIQRYQGHFEQIFNGAGTLFLQRLR